MMLYLLRHAKAIPRQGRIQEEHRYLSEEGRERFNVAARNLREKGLEPDLILTSPLARSLQTAEILACALDYRGPLRIVPELAPGFDRPLLSRLFKAHSWARQLVLVGHEPDLSLLITRLLGIGAHFTLKKGDLVAIEFVDDGRAAFRWRTFRGIPTESLVDTD